MEQVIFGTFATDELKVLHHRLFRRGVQHQHDLSPRDPEPGEIVTLTISVGADVTAEHAACYYTVDGTQPAGSRGVARHGDVAQFEPDGVVWDSVAWGYQTRWKCVLPAQPENTIIRYQIGVWSGDAPEIFPDWPLVKATSEQATAAFFRGEPVSHDLLVGDPHEPHTFTCSVDRLKPPAWAHKAVIYHIFVDRFNPGQGRDWLQTGDLKTFFGGTLWGVAEKMDYIADLGANTIWLSPVFCSPTHHGYDVTDYQHVEPRLGGDEALRHVISAAHETGIRVILDIALNHLSNQHPYFQDARSNPASPYRDWFTFDDSEAGYRSYFGVVTMPQINVASPGACRWLIDVSLFWLREYGIDGYRLDVADGPGPDFWTDFWLACKAQNPDCYCFGEVIDAPDIQQQYIGRLDGVLDFHLCDALRRTFAQRKWSESEFQRFLTRHQQFFPRDFLMPTFVDNHDMDRFLFQAHGDKAALQRAAEIQMSLPNPPVIYYGTEIGLNQGLGSADGWGHDANRIPMVWGDGQAQDLLTFYKKIIRQRLNNL
jgi:cyclomaltodextrinase / maltogenic alpha-amylase / neopullulanase